MYNFVVDNRNENDKAVTGKYMSLLLSACQSVGETKTIINGEKPKNKKEFIVCDTVQTAFWYLLRGYKKQIVWMQGVAPEESYMRNQSKLRYKVLSFMEKRVLKRSKMLLLVSEEMLSHYEKKYKLSLKEKSVVMPCFNETGVEEDAFYQEKYEKNDFLYVGGMAKWQCFGAMASLFAKIEQRQDSTFFVYTFEKEKAEEILREKGVKKYVVDYAPKAELSQRIKGIKYGFVLREDCTVNNVATPTKFSNYLANGIIPIYSDALKSFAKVDEGQKVGIVCNVDDLELGAKKVVEHAKEKIDADAFKEKCKWFFENYYDEKTYVEIMQSKIKELQ